MDSRHFFMERFTKHTVVYLLLLLLFSSCSDKMQVSKVKTQEYVLAPATNNETDSAILKVIQPYRDRMSADMNTVLAESAQPLEKAVPEGILGDLVADAAFRAAKNLYYPDDGKQIDFAFLNNGGLRKSLPKGPITRGDVFEVLPFENELVVLTMSGGLVRKTVDFIASKGGQPVSAIRFQIKASKASEIMIGNVPFDSSRTYKVLTLDYLANGGDQFGFLSQASKRENLNVKLRDVMIQYLESFGKTGQKLTVQRDGRISTEE